MNLMDINFPLYKFIVQSYRYIKFIELFILLYWHIFVRAMKVMCFDGDKAI